MAGDRLSATQNGDLVTKCEELEFEFDATVKPADEPREERRKQCEHTGAIRGLRVKSPDFSLLSEPLAGTTDRFQFLLNTPVEVLLDVRRNVSVPIYAVVRLHVFGQRNYQRVFKKRESRADEVLIMDR